MHRDNQLSEGPDNSHEVVDAPHVALRAALVRFTGFGVIAVAACAPHIAQGDA
jgi:hypothetical protein